MCSWLKWLKILIIFNSSLVIIACSSSHKQNEFSKKIGFPTETKTRATDYLGCFGDMLTTYRMNGRDLDLLRLAVVSVLDSTNVSTTQSNFPSEIPSDFTDMALGITSSIGGPVRVMHVPSPQELLDATRYGNIPGKKPPFLNSFKATHYRNDTLQIYGALTEYDRILDNSQKEGDASIEFGKGSGITNLEVSASGIVNVARMTMDFRVAYAAVGDIVNHSSSSNTVTVYQRGIDRSFGLSVDGNSIGYSFSKSVVDARHKAIRLLIEWGLIESIGRYAMVPYWKCLPNSENKKQIGFKDLVNNDNFYDFQNLNSVNKSTRKGANTKPGLIDMRDKILLNAVLSDFNNAEYLKNNTRKLLKRPEKDTSLVVRKTVTETVPVKSVVNGKTVTKNKTVQRTVDQKSMIEGKSTLRNSIIQHYRRDKSYAKLSDSALLKRLHYQLVKAKILNPKDNMMGANTYLAMWLNVPVIKGSRWRK